MRTIAITGLGLAGLAFVTACSSSKGSVPVAPVVPPGTIAAGTGVSPTPIVSTSASPVATATATATASATATATATASASPSAAATATATATATASASPTATASAPATSTSTFKLSCSNPPAALGANYTGLRSVGTIGSGGYVQNSGSWTAYTLTAGSSGVTFPQPNPTTPPIAYTLVAGVYSIPSFTKTTTVGTHRTYTAAATSGCLALFLAPAGSTLPGVTPPANAIGGGYPSNAYDGTASAAAIDTGSITSFSLPANSTSGSFTLDNGVVGTFTIAGSSQATYARR